MAKHTVFCFLLGLALVSLCYAIPVYVMLPLDTVSNNNVLNNPQQLQQQLQQLKSAGVTGIMTDVWWGLVEQQPQKYDWSAYIQLVQLAQSTGLLLQTVMSFHQCGGNVGDACNIPLPSWVLDVGNQNDDIFYKDQSGHADREYLSSGVDNIALFPNQNGPNQRTAADLYADYMQSFVENFKPYLGSIAEVQVGLGPAGEMRYPSYQSDRWNFPGVGEFQSYDKYLSQQLASAAQAAGHPEWAGSPNNAGDYNSFPYDTQFFSDNQPNNYASDYGRFFLGWYSQTLQNHGSNVLSRAYSIFQNTGVRVAAKIAGIHWWYKTSSHAAELTAGYYNTDGVNAYQSIAQLFAKFNVAFDFTCLEMRDSEQPANCACGPEELVSQTQADAFSFNLAYGAENALQRYDNTAYQQIEAKSSYNGHLINAFTYLRLTPELLQQDNFSTFTAFVQQMNSEQQ